MPAKRLYYNDPYLREFECTVLSCEITTRYSMTPLYEIITDVTAFYPNSGGQPSDRGTIGDAELVDVIERDDEVIHITTTSVPLGPALCRIDADRRFDHMQQHTGQHILSAAFHLLFGMETVGFHLSEDTVTIDLNYHEVSRDQAAAAERLACEVVFQDHPITASFWSRADLDVSHLRKLPTRSENIRVVDIDGFDQSPCGGTHARATGEVGLIKIIRTEKIRGITRVEFACGRRALGDYRWKNDVVHLAASTLSVHGKELPDAVSRLQGQLREMRKELNEAISQIHAYQAKELFESASPIGESGVRIISHILENASVDSLKSLAHKACDNPRTIALLASNSQTMAHLVFQRSQDVSLDMSVLLKSVLPTIHGKGGGSPFLAQGGGKNVSALKEAIEEAVVMASSKL